jgi:hypothetical protein
MMCAKMIHEQINLVCGHSTTSVIESSFVGNETYRQKDKRT